MEPPAAVRLAGIITPALLMPRPHRSNTKADRRRRGTPGLGPPYLRDGHRQPDAGLFFGDGLAGDVPAAVALARGMEDDGADIIDVGAESTRPGSAPVSAEAEAARLLPALEAICAAVSIPVSVDTYKARVAQQAVDAGAAMINDVWGLLADGAMAPTIAAAGCAGHPDAQPA